MKLVDVLRLRLTDPVLEVIWDEMLAGWSTATDAERATLGAWVRRKRDDFLAFAAECVDDDELEQYAALQYIELRAHWQSINNRLNYAMVTAGSTDPRLVYRSAMMSQLLGAVEGVLDPASVSRIMSFLSEPISARRRDEAAA
ncbi:MAG: hypothetical protein MUC96_19435 [Myxococcaceae bacterium]|jgi:hypothetical protein|nr:hypothetical protein [Myxococcaceae bacterium]